MNNRLTRLSLIAGWLLLAMLFGSGCVMCRKGSIGSIKRYNIEVTRDDSLQNAYVQVDLVGVPANSLDQWLSYSVSDYWKPDDSRRKGAEKHTFVLDSNSPETQILSVDDEIWDVWENQNFATHLVLLAQLPGIHTDQHGTRDGRRQVIHLGSCYWPWRTKEIKLSVKRSGVDILTPPRSMQ